MQSVNKFYILETKYAIASHVLDYVNTNKQNRTIINRSLSSEFTDTVKQLAVRYKLESELYGRIKKQDVYKYYESSADIAINGKQWKNHVKAHDFNINLLKMINLTEIESFNIPPLSFALWPVMHAKYKMSSMIYALPLYTIHGIDVIHASLNSLISRYEPNNDDEALDLEIENVQNKTFYKLAVGKSKLVIIWLDSPNLPMPWKSNPPEGRYESPLLDRCYILQRNVEFIDYVCSGSSGGSSDNLIDILVEHLIKSPMLIYSPDIPYDLNIFQNSSCIFDTVLQYSPQDIWKQMASLQTRHMILAQQMPRTFSQTPLDTDRLLYWMTLDRIPTNLLLRNVTNIGLVNRNKQYNMKFVYVSHSLGTITVLSVSTASTHKVRGLGPLIPPIMMSVNNFESLTDSMQILQNMTYLGVYNAVLFTDHAIRPLSQFVTEKNINLLEKVQTLSVANVISIFKNYFNEDKVVHETIATSKDLRFTKFVFKHITCYTFISPENVAYKFNMYDAINKMMLENKQTLFTHYRNLSITISHFIDYYHSSIISK